GKWIRPNYSPFHYPLPIFSAYFSLGLTPMNWHDFVPHAVVAVASIFFAVAPFLPRYRAISWWMRGVFFALALSGIAWSGIGFWLLLHSTQLTRQARWTVFHGKATLGG